ncbi:MAG: hypothetical protein HPY67_09175 [Syntrophaceae bacterium]|nr:hypothetical protein [Syntrophaceae bacterium]
MRASRFLTFLCSFVCLLALSSAPGLLYAATPITFTGEELLGKPTNTSITVNIVPDSTIEYHYQYGTSPGVYSGQTPNQTAAAGQPHEVTLTGLTANTRYYYRMRYHAPGDAMDDWVTRAERSFHTQRARGSTYTFTITSDAHGTFNQQVLQQIIADPPDFNIDLGDTFYTDNTTSQTAVNNRYLLFRGQSYFGAIGHSVPIFLASGNHENEEGWNLDDTPFSIGVASIQARKAYYPTPVNNGFYSGNTDPLARIDEATYGDELRENYYAWEWGDALFVVIDPFQYTMNLPYTPVAGEGSDDAVTGDQWSWTLGAQQFNWLKQVIQNSTAKYKFVLSHQMVGGIPNLWISGAGPGYVRGGAQAAGYFEWGGKNANGTEGFADHRDADFFGTQPIHQFMVENGVSAYFHGHDHQYVYEMRNGIVYQALPSAGAASAFSGVYVEGDHGDYITIRRLTSVGHLRISITPTQAIVDYYTSAGTIAYSYTIAPNAAPCPGDLNGDRQVNAADLAIFAANYGLSGSGDYNGDGDVDGHDLATLVGAFGTTCP